MTVPDELFHEAHAQLLARDEELLQLVRQFTELLAGSRLHNSSDAEWALRSIHHDAIIQQLRSQLSEQSTWAERSSEDVRKRDVLIRQLQGSHAEQIAERDEIIRQLQASLAEQTSWAQQSAGELASRDEIVRQLQSSLEEQSAWAQRSAEEVAKRDELIRQLQSTISNLTKSRPRRWFRR